MLVICQDMSLSTKTEKIGLVLTYDHVWIDHPLDIIVKIDNKTLHIDVSGKQTIKLDKKIVINEGDHLMTIQVTNKDNKSIVIDNQNNIVSNSFVKITSFVINDINLMTFVDSESKFLDVNNNILHQPGGIYDNGVWQLPFKTPIYTWLLEKLF